MTRQNNDSSFKLNIGGPSIILLLTVLGLSVFAILSIRAAYSGLKSARTSAAAAERYYAAESKVSPLIFEINETAASADTLTIPELETRIAAIDGVESIGDGCIECRIAIDVHSYLCVELQGESDYSGLEIAGHRMIVDSMDGYSGSGFELSDDFEIIL